VEWPLQFGLFLAPLHHPQQNPTRALRRDLELIVRAEELGFTEAWIGEHYSTGHEIIAGGDLFVAAAAERTKRIRLGTGATSLPFHHPFVVASRAVQLDHMTMGVHPRRRPGFPADRLDHDGSRPPPATTDDD
jgi:limonene 1,2-monooxygenase